MHFPGMQFVLKVDALNELRAFEEAYLLDARGEALASALTGSDVIFYRPRRGPSASLGGASGGSYFAWGRVSAIDGTVARIDGFDHFHRPVPLRLGRFRFEPAIWLGDGSPDGSAFQRRVRPIDAASFDDILTAGSDLYDDLLPPPPLAAEVRAGLSEPQGTFELPLRYRLKSEVVRTEAFTRAVDRAYGRRCVVSGFEIGAAGAFEAERVHFHPLGSGGPNSVRNGAPMAQTIHWMFDRGLFAICDDYRIVLGPGISSVERRRLFPNPTIRLPADPAERPHPDFLGWHRRNMFKAQA